MMDLAVYQRIQGADYRRIFVVGDIHGCRQQLEDLLCQQVFCYEKDLLLSVGDLIDRGPDSLGCLSLITQPWFVAVRGNHEQMAIDAVHGRHIERWLGNGGGWFYKLSANDEARARQLLRQAESLPHILELHCGQRLTVIAHADYPLDHYHFNQPVDSEQVLWQRRRIDDAVSGESCPITGAERFFFGHTPLAEVAHYANQHYIDTGAVFGGKLTMLQIQ